ncbi:MAG: hypothetical protein ACRDOK_19210 [Streptosporangiaceae bacterium]
MLSGDGHPVAASAAALTPGQFYDVILAGDVACRFPRAEKSRRRQLLRGRSQAARRAAGSRPRRSRAGGGNGRRRQRP